MEAPAPIIRTRVFRNRTITVIATWTPAYGLWSVIRKVDGKLVEVLATPTDPALHVQRLIDKGIGD
jgi:hypothetical protein